jgi:VanZ family protein
VAPEAGSRITADRLARAARPVLALALGLITWLALTPAGPELPGQTDKLAHAAAFLALAGLTDFAFPRHGFNWAKALPLLAYGLGIEVIQGFLPHRFASAADWLADALGLALYLLAVPLLRRLPLLRVRWAG